jgi:hypothetical protein
MKFKLIIFVISFFSILSCSQTKEVDYESGIKRSLTAMVENIKSKNIENAVNFIYPKYLDLITREQMIKILNISYNNPSMMVDIQDFKIDNIEKPQLIDKEYFSITNYSFKMKLKIDWNSIPNKDIVKQKMEEAMILKYGKENVQYLGNDDYFLINAKMKACAISNEGKDWTFLMLDKKYKSEIVGLVPEKILEKF